MLFPKRVKYRKQMRGRMRGKALRAAEVQFGTFGLQALEPGWVSARQIEAARRSLVHSMKRRGKCGYVFSRINLSLNVPQNPVWVKVKAP